MKQPAREQPEYFEPPAPPPVVDIFQSVGFDVPDEDSYSMLAEHTESSGEHSCAHRGDTSVHGWCWKLGEGLEVWSVLYEHEDEMYHADCRPAFRGRYVYHVQPWELVEFDEDGEALVRGRVNDKIDLIFELQNLTELPPSMFQHSYLHVSLAGLAYSAQIHPSTKQVAPRFELAETLPEFEQDACESDYIIRGRVIAWREIENPVTESRLVWLYVEAGETNIEILVSRSSLRGRPRTGAIITANIWLQGHVLEAEDLFARYEGVDWDFPAADFWMKLRRDN